MRRNGLLIVGILLVVVVGVAALVTSGSDTGTFKSTATTAASEPRVPLKLAGMARGRVETGNAAQAAIDHMHGGKSVAPGGSVIAHYQSQAGRATVWVSDFRDPKVAASELDRMVQGIDKASAGDNAPFTKSRTATVAGKPVYVADGMGQNHYFWQDGPLVYWLAADQNVSADAAAELAGASHY